MHKLVIKNFGPVRNISLNLEQMTLIIGEQANGKSTITKLIYFFRRFQLFFSIVYSTKEYALWKDFRKAYLSQMKTIFTNTFGSTKTLGNFELEYYFTDSESISIVPTDDNTFLNIRFSPGLNNRLHSLWNLIRNEYNSGSFVRESGILWGAYHNDMRALPEIFNDVYSCVYVPAGRALLSRQSLLDMIQANEMAVGSLTANYNAFDLIDAITRDYMREVSAMRTIFSRRDIYSLAELIEDEERRATFLYMCELQKEILKGDYTTDGKYDYIILKPGKRVPISYASSGQQEVLWITNLLLGYLAKGDKKTCILVEEPETHLHPDAQYSLVKFIAAYQNFTGSQVLVTTHSPYVLSSLNNLFYACKISKETKSESINEIISRQCWVDENSFQAFSIEEGELADIKDSDLAMVDIARLDSIVSRQDDEYEAMLGILKENRKNDISIDSLRKNGG